jgi:FkbM family methyltransferase
MSGWIGAAVRRLLRFWGGLGRKHGYFYQVMEAYGPRLATNQPLLVTLPNGLHMECDLRDHVQRHIYFMGVYEPVESHLFSRLVKNGWTVFDVGSNVGQYALLASPLVGKSGGVHAFEPVPHNFDRARRHLTLNHVVNVFLHRLAAWHERTEVQLGLASDMTENAGSYSVGAVSGTAVVPVKAQSIPLDDYVADRQIERVDLVKMDIEGAELNALRGFVKTLRRDRPVILMEVNRVACLRAGYEPAQLWELLIDQLGYRVWKIGHSAHDWVEIADPARIEQANCLFTPGDLPQELTDSWDFRHCVAWAASAGRGGRYLPPQGRAEGAPDQALVG